MNARMPSGPIADTADTVLAEVVAAFAAIGLGVLKFVEVGEGVWGHVLFIR